VGAILAMRKIRCMAGLCPIMLIELPRGASEMRARPEILGLGAVRARAHPATPRAATRRAAALAATVNRHRWVLLCLGGVIAAAAGGIAHLGDLGERARAMLLLWGVAHAAYLGAAWWSSACRAHNPSRSRRRPGFLASAESALARAAAPLPCGHPGAGLLARALLIPAAPTLSEDVYRYSGTAAGGARHQSLPARALDPALERFHDELLRRLNQPGTHNLSSRGPVLFGAAALISATRPHGSSSCSRSKPLWCSRSTGC